jgi:TPR repeat protein
MANRNCNVARVLIPGIMMGTIGLSSNVLGADEYTLGLDLISKGQYAQAFQLIKESAEKGEVKSQFVLSTMYRRGLGVDADEYKGFDWCEKAAREGHLEAQFQLGLMYLEGEGVTEDETKAQNWLWEAADRGYPQASEVLTYIFSEDYHQQYGLGC